MIYRLLLDQALTVRSTPGKGSAVACETRFAQTAQAPAAPPLPSA